MAKPGSAAAAELLRRLEEQLIDTGNVLVYNPATAGIPPFRFCTVEELKAALEDQKKPNKPEKAI